MKHTETIENIIKVMQTFAVYEDMPPAEQLAIAEDVKPLYEQCGTGIAVYYTADWEPDELFGKMHFVGWDIAVKENGDIEPIEVNSIPDMTIEQLFYGPMAKKFRKLYGSREYGK